jgi:uncharacterized membrane protein
VRGSGLWRERLRGSLWILPSVSVVIALVSGTLLAEVRAEPPEALEGFLFTGDADAAQALLSVVAGSIITVTSLVFSLTVLTLQIASSQYSPRLLRNFLQDRGNQIVLSTFLSTFAYCLAVLRTVQTDDVPQLAITGVLAFVVASLVALVYVIHHIAHSIRLDTIMRSVERQVLAAMDRNHPDEVTGPTWRNELPEVPPNAATVLATDSGFLQTLSAADLLPLAEKHDVVIRFAPMVGAQVVRGAVLAWVWPRTGSQRVDSNLFTRPVNDIARLGFERTLVQDVAFGIRQLVDIAVKGLSKAINDPATAVESIGHLSVIMARLATRRLGSYFVSGDGATVRVAVPRRDFRAYLDLACGQIRRYGADEPAVAEALLDLLDGVAENTTSDDRRAVILDNLRMITAAAEQAVAEEADLRPVWAAAERVTATLKRASLQHSRPQIDENLNRLISE